MSKISLALPAWAPPLFPERGVQKFLSKVILLMLALFVSGCSQANSDDYTAGDLRAIDHVDGRAINGFSVNGYHVSGLGGGACCVMLPNKWYSGMQAKIEWETDPDPYADLPALGTDAYRAAYAKHAANYQQHSAIADIPAYGKERCGMTVHFLTCNRVKVTTVCEGYGTPSYPVKDPLHMKEPASCPK